MDDDDNNLCCPNKECTNYFNDDIFLLNEYNVIECDKCGDIHNRDKDSFHQNDCSVLENIKNYKSFTKNKDNQKCNYCFRYLSKCNICENPCYTCVFNDCMRSQITGQELKNSSFVCQAHANTYQNSWVQGVPIILSDVDCEKCGVKKHIYIGDCCKNNRNNNERFYNKLYT